MHASLIISLCPQVDFLAAALAVVPKFIFCLLFVLCVWFIYIYFFFSDFVLFLVNVVFCVIVGSAVDNMSTVDIIVSPLDAVLCVCVQS